MIFEAVFSHSGCKLHRQFHNSSSLFGLWVQNHFTADVYRTVRVFATTLFGCGKYEHVGGMLDIAIQYSLQNPQEKLAQCRTNKDTRAKDGQ